MASLGFAARHDIVVAMAAACLALTIDSDMARAAFGEPQGFKWDTAFGKWVDSTVMLIVDE